MVKLAFNEISIEFPGKFVYRENYKWASEERHDGDVHDVHIILGADKIDQSWSYFEFQ